MSYPELQQWVLERVALGGSEKEANASSRMVAAMATRLGVPPSELPDNAVSLHFSDAKGKGIGASGRKYGVALRSWLRYARERSASVKSHATPQAITDPDFLAWEDALLGEGRNEETFKRYARAVTDLCHIVGKPPRELTKPDITRALRVISDRIEARKGRPMRAGYRNSFIAALRSFYFCLEIQNPPTQFIRSQRGASDKTKPIEEDDYERLCAGALQLMEENRGAGGDAAVYDWARRHYAATLVMGTAGVRIGTARRLRPAWVQPRDGWPHFRVPGQATKGHEAHDARWIPCPTETAAWLSENFQAHEAIYPLEWNSTRATNEFKSFAERFGVFTHPHQLRALVADVVYDTTGGNVKAVKVQLDHDDDATSLGYVSDRRAVSKVRHHMDTTNVHLARPTTRKAANVVSMARPAKNSEPIPF
ncbi:hypothetical protein [Streptomyces sp. NPDC050485]|uniref:hypothetical protein n=1 Tax=Streptomyces sp. NPDC050485 TaxID=3365617 RepID=UPI0037962A6E